MRRLLPALSLALGLSSCALGPDYERPEIDVPADFRAPLATGPSLANVEWWNVLQDAQLNKLINIALLESKDLLIATARLEEARARLGFVRANQWPRLDINAGAARGNSAKRFLPDAAIQENYFVTADLFFEVDLFGKLRRATEAARAELLASEEARKTVYIALIADVASTYFLLRDLDARREVAARTVATRRDSTNIIRERFKRGIAPMLDVNQAEIEEADAAADLVAFERQLVQTENLLSILVGRNPGPIARGDKLTEQPRPPAVPAGLPAELLERRPDVRAAELALAAQTARIGVAGALRFPTLSLTASGGLASNDLSQLNDGDASIWNVGANLFAPVFNAGQNKRNVDIERTRTERLLQQYELIVLQAFREVEDALTAIRTLRDEAAAREMQVRAARNAAFLSRARYDGGVTSYLEVLDLERSLFQAEIAASSVRRARLVAIVELYKALGGGWLPQ